MDVAGLTGWLDNQAAVGQFSGVALIWRDGAPVLSFAGGVAERRFATPIRFDTRFAVGSVTKVVVAAACLRLVDRGLVGLHQPLTDVLPSDQQPDALTPAHELHHLLSHTSGLANYHDTLSTSWASFLSAWDRVPTYHARGPADLLPLFMHLPATGPPGVEFAYADANYVLAGLVIEAITGQPWTEFATAEVLGPAGMVDSGFPYLDDDPPRLATGYLVTDGPQERWLSNVYSVPAGGMPDGGLVTTATDLARLFDALEGGGLLSPTAHAAMTTPQDPDREVLERYGYGCVVTVQDNRVTIIGHDGMDPGVSASVSRYRDAATTIVVVSNQDRGCWPVVARLAAEAALDDPRS